MKKNDKKERVGKVRNIIIILRCLFPQKSRITWRACNYFFVLYAIHASLKIIRWCCYITRWYCYIIRWHCYSTRWYRCITRWYCYNCFFAHNFAKRNPRITKIKSEGFLTVPRLLNSKFGLTSLRIKM
jgi:hypothetical protein